MSDTWPKLHVLIVGGYGEFGGRLAQLLQRDHHLVSIAGRNLSKAKQFCELHGGNPVELDINKSLSVIDSMDIDVVVDAAGPYQSYGEEDQRYRLARKTLEAGKHYLDLSDDGVFSAGIDTLDHLAKKQGRVAISGASSTPALSAAAVDALKKNVGSIEKIETSILPGSRAPQGHSVMQAILDQVGNPVPFWRNRQWVDCTGWSEPAIKSIGQTIKRKANLINAADTVLFPTHFNARTVLFRAGLAVPLMHDALQGLGTQRAKKRLPNLTKLTTVLQVLAKAITPFGNDHGGMLVELTGLSANKNHSALQHCEWELEAAPGQGPFVPAIPIRALLRNITSLSPGARACLQELPLSSYVTAMDDIGITTGFRHNRFRYLFEHTLGEQWHNLPDSVRLTHRVLDQTQLNGVASISRGTSMLMRFIGWVFRFPSAASNIPLQVTKTRSGDNEVWVRNFNGQIFQSRLSPVDSPHAHTHLIAESEKSSSAMVWEQFGLLKFLLHLPVDNGAMQMNVIKGTCLGIPIPRALLPLSNTSEYAANNTMHFSVEIVAPFKLGLIVHYQGWLK